MATCFDDANVSLKKCTMRLRYFLVNYFTLKKIQSKKEQSFLFFVFTFIYDE